MLFLVPGGVGGSEIYTRALLRALADVDETNHYYIFRNAETDASIVPDKENFHDRPQRVHASGRPERIAYEQTLFLVALAKARIDVLFNCGFTAPLAAWMPMVSVFYDLQYKHFGSALKSLDLVVTSILLPASARRSKAIVAMTDAVREDLETYFPWSAERIVLIPHGIDPDFNVVRKSRESGLRTGRPRPFLLAVSTLMLHKNFESLLVAFEIFRRTHPEFELIVVGLKGRDTARLETLRTKLGLDEHVTFTGWIARSEVLQFFAEARAFVYASLFEGFGIPVLEALTAGVPMACSQIAPIVEIAGTAARYFDPTSVADMSDALCEIVDDADLRARLAREGPLRAQRFDARENARKLVDLFGSLPRRRTRA